MLIEKIQKMGDKMDGKRKKMDDEKKKEGKE